MTQRSILTSSQLSHQHMLSPLSAVDYIDHSNTDREQGAQRYRERIVRVESRLDRSQNQPVPGARTREEARIARLEG
jgi:hypothetical protein